MAARTRREALKDLAENYTVAHPNEGPSRIASERVFVWHQVGRLKKQNAHFGRFLAACLQLVYSAAL